MSMAGITVGVDGSDNSRTALEWAMKEAALRKSPLTVIAVHEVAANQWTGHPLIVREDAADEVKARQATEEDVAKITSQLGDAAPASVTVNAVSGIAAQVLIDASAHADLVVVGSKGGGGFARMLVGSVSSKVVHHAACPVVVVR
jgi:nucleotide-binding universal stress UspA family protein